MVRRVAMIAGVGVIVLLLLGAVLWFTPASGWLAGVVLRQVAAHYGTPMEKARVESTTGGVWKISEMSAQGLKIESAELSVRWEGMAPVLDHVALHGVELLLACTDEGCHLGPWPLTGEQKADGSQSLQLPAIPFPVRTISVDQSTLLIAMGEAPEARFRFSIDAEAKTPEEVSIALEGQLASNWLGGQVVADATLTPKQGREASFRLSVTTMEGSLEALFPSIHDGKGVAQYEKSSLHVSGSLENQRLDATVDWTGKAQMAIPGIGNLSDVRFWLTSNLGWDGNLLVGRLSQLMLATQEPGSLAMGEENALFFEKAEWLAIGDKDRKDHFSFTLTPDAQEGWGQGKFSAKGSLAPLKITGLLVNDDTTGVAGLDFRPQKFSLDGTYGGQEAVVLSENSSGRATLKIDALDLERLLSIWLGDQVKASGKLSGAMEWVLEKGELRVEDGKLEALEHGTIQYTPSNPQAMNVQGMDVLLEALQDFKFTLLSSEITSMDKEKLVAKVRLEGANPALYDGTVVQLNLNLSVDYKDAWDAGTEAWKLQQKIVDKAAGN